ncbi:Fc.00g033150.m01.CDS01 [Cosmosporella sp. VM-42]
MASKRTILVTGCSDGSLGSALAVALHEAGWRVFASARNPSKLSAVKEAGIECVQIDVGSDQSIAAGVEQVKQLTGGSLDALVNNAGMGSSAAVIEMDIDKAHDLFDLNVFSIVRVTRKFLPLLLKSTSGALLINNTSASSLLGCGLPFQYTYNASKAAASSLTEGLRIELAPFGIRVINLITGGVKSAFYDNAHRPELAADSIYNLAKDEIERPMAGDQKGMHKPDAMTWARQVAKDLAQRKPPYLVFRGASAGTARLATLLPIGTVDGTLKKLSGLDIFEQKLKKAGGLEQATQKDISERR